mmetsp:Transcript_9248/g.9325  ORF Transcript_9248/g.9325 Transcript_9248/m.9325 type:complete len:286 (-) Transcript_9248:23-880(-)|eukprot:CAMPEP_0182418020 /NCGR_PEP_ID=MMETSP1167-20130531/2476_1 /TAXON_ID=2988 /ORGANISM="Mallomonas Sp, Strain CCMP3275" /LENGTH=285 /DNA_ID=CAMNT_0024591969 /DNA_START=330 /DNA_END=1187 /DNA_ORIENTATION=+
MSNRFSNNRFGDGDDESSIQEPGIESEGRAFFVEEDNNDDDDKTSDGDDDENAGDDNIFYPQKPTPPSTKPQIFTTPPKTSNRQFTKVEESHTPIRTLDKQHTAGTEVSPGPPVHAPLLSQDESKRAEDVFDLCNTFNEQHLNKDQFAHALAVLGQKADEKKVKELYASAADSLNVMAFKQILSQLRSEADSDRNAKVEEAFEALFSGTCKDADRQKDTSGRKFILVKDLRLVLTTYGDKLSDEEADELIRECHPEPGDEGDKTDEGLRRIFFDNYRAMLLDSGL